MTGLLADFDGGIRALTIFLLVGVITTAFSLRAAFWNRRTFNRLSESWDQVQAKIEHTDVYVEARGKIDMHVAQVKYSYRVRDEYYSGEYTKDFLREKKAYEFIDSFPRGIEIVVRCLPKDPSVSAMREDDNSALLAGTRRSS